MYSKYEEMRVMKQVMQNYADNQKKQYESTIATLKEEANSFPLDINSDRTNTEISSLQSTVRLLSGYSTDYQSAQSVVSELNKVDFPTLGSPTIPSFMVIFSFTVKPFQAF